jgi:uncharacterized protein
MKKISAIDLEDLALGSAILGSGGGGDPSYDLLMAQQQFETGEEVKLVEVGDLAEDAVIAPIAFMGAPLVGIEKLPSGEEFPAVIASLEELIGKKVTHLLAAEIGGANAFTPVIAGSQLGLPVIDGDTLGRAFPELQMSSCNLMGVSPTPAVLGDALGKTVSIRKGNAVEAEKFFREKTIEMGSSAAVSLYIMSGREAKRSIISGSYSKAIGIGKTIRQAKEQGQNPIKALIENFDALSLFSGMIVDIDQSIEEGFLTGSFSITNDDTFIKVLYQNEYLAVFDGEKPLVSTPDIIIPLEQETGSPITSETLQYGVRVELIALPSPKLWTSEEALNLVGPQYFGYKIDYQDVQINKNEEIRCVTT